VGTGKTLTVVLRSPSMSSADIRIPADRIEESRLRQYPTNALERGQYHLRELLILIGISCAALGFIKAVIQAGERQQSASHLQTKP